MEKINSMKKNKYILLVLTLLTLSCRKKDFPVTRTASESDFYFKGTIDGNPVTIKAGKENYYMYAGHTHDSSSLYRFVADLKQGDCVNCKNRLQIVILDYKYTAGTETTRIDSSLHAGSYPLLGSPFYAVQFRSMSNKQAVSYLWNFGDNTYSNEASPLHVYKTAGKYKVSLKIDNDNGCQQYISNVEEIRYPATFAKISVQSNSANQMSFSTSLPASSEYTFYWDFGDGETSTLSNPSHNYKISGTYPVQLRVTDDQQDTIYSRYNVATQTNPMPCLSNYYVESLTPVPHPSPFSHIIINWTDANGEVYTSNNFLQPITSSFKILSVEDYDNNEKGEKTKKIKVLFTCKVYNGTRVKTIENAEALVSVSYK
jgi:PKD repeat protein